MSQPTPKMLAKLADDAIKYTRCVIDHPKNSRLYHLFAEEPQLIVDLLCDAYAEGYMTAKGYKANG